MKLECKDEHILLLFDWLDVNKDDYITFADWKDRIYLSNEYRKYIEDVIFR